MSSEFLRDGQELQQTAQRRNRKRLTGKLNRHTLGGKNRTVKKMARVAKKRCLSSTCTPTQTKGYEIPTASLRTNATRKYVIKQTVRVLE